MSAGSVINIEWPNVNVGRNYPLSQGATLKSGTFELPNDLIVDFVFPVNIDVTPALDISKFHLAQVGVFSNGVVLSFGYDEEIFATVNIPVSGFTDYSTYAITGTSSQFDGQGWVTIGHLSTILNSPGAWTFDVDAGRLEPTVIRPALSALSSITVINGAEQSTPITGDIILSAGRNIQLRVDTSGAVPIIVIDAVNVDSSYEEDCDCNDLNADAPPIRTINGVAPNDAGAIILNGSSCISIQNGSSTITIIDSCSEPCCDCNELNVITSTVEQMSNQVRTLELMGSRLDEVISNVSSNLLTSKTTGIPSSLL